MPGGFFSMMLSWLQILVGDGNVCSLQAFRAVLDAELNLLALLQGPEAISLDCSEVDKHVGSTLALDKAVTLRCIKPLDRSSYTFVHFVLLLQNQSVNF
jgi:hypothetical protein